MPRPAPGQVRGEGYEQDLERLAFYLREQKPVVIAVDGAADALLAQGVRPALVLGDMDSVSDAARVVEVVRIGHRSDVYR